MAYVKTLWLSGEVISAARLNHIEDGIYANSLIPVITIDQEFDSDSGNPVANSVISGAIDDIENDMLDWSDGLSGLSHRVDDVEDDIDDINDDITDNIKPDITSLQDDITDNIKPAITTLQTTVSGKLDPDDIYPMFAKTDVTESITVNANAYNSKVGSEFTKAGYYPLAIMGYDFASTVCFPVKMSIADPAVGSGKIFFGVKNTSGSAVTFDAKFYILWIKTN